MKPLSRSDRPGKICVPVIETTVPKALHVIKKAHQVADLIELRLDYLRDPQWPSLLVDSPLPVIVTHRRKEEGGRYQGDEKKRIALLKEAVELGARYVDVELRSDRSKIQTLIERKKGTEIILSFHDFRGTPPFRALRGLVDRMIRMGGDIVKIVTFAEKWEDNGKTLLLIPYALERGKRIVTFCMGKKGKMSRVFSPMMGSAWTYAPLAGSRASAPGQLTVTELKDLWKRLNLPVA
jgi:3-dehydroquinate dehydratase type I